MKAGEIYLVRVRNHWDWKEPTACFNVVLRWITWKKFPHEGFKIWHEERYWMCHAIWPSVQKEDYDAWYNSMPRRTGEVELEEIICDNAAEIKENAFKYIGVPYDWLGLIFMLIYLISRFIVRTLTLGSLNKGLWIGPTGQRAERRMFCAKYRAMVLNQEYAYRAVPSK